MTDFMSFKYKEMVGSLKSKLSFSFFSLLAPHVIIHLECYRRRKWWRYLAKTDDVIKQPSRRTRLMTSHNWCCLQPIMAPFSSCTMCTGYYQKRKANFLIIWSFSFSWLTFCKCFLLYFWCNTKNKFLYPSITKDVEK